LFGVVLLLKAFSVGSLLFVPENLPFCFCFQIVTPSLPHLIPETSVVRPRTFIQTMAAAASARYFTPLLRPLSRTTSSPAFLPRVVPSINKPSSFNHIRLFTSPTNQKMANPYFDVTWTDQQGTSTFPSPQIFISIISFQPPPPSPNPATVHPHSDGLTDRTLLSSRARLGSRCVQALR
jgi:hypothetical protein